MSKTGPNSNIIITETVKNIMESGEGLCGSTVKLNVPLTVCITVGRSWAHMEEYQTSHDKATRTTVQQETSEDHQTCVK